MTRSHLFAYLLAITATVILSRCGGGNSTSLHAAPLWTAAGDITTCEAMAPANCSGYYGFTVDNAGNYASGPNPAGQQTKGVLTAAEWSKFQNDADTLAADIAQHPALLCQAKPQTPGSSDVVYLQSGGVSYKLQDAAGNLCAPGEHVAEVTAYVDDVDSLRAKYYPSPF